MEQTIKNVNIKKLIKELPSVAKRGNWVFTYDEDEGPLFYSPVEIPEGSVLYPVNDEYSLYLNKENNFSLEGMFVECFDKNFIEHHKEFKKLSKELFRISDDEDSIESAIITINPQKDDSSKAATFKNLLEKTFISETLKTS